jgi:hypothetical protein
MFKAQRLILKSKGHSFSEKIRLLIEYHKLVALETKEK